MKVRSDRKQASTSWLNYSVRTGEAHFHCKWRDNPLSLRHDCLLKLGVRTTRDRGCRRYNGAGQELTRVFATPRPVTTLIRNVQPHEFSTVSPFIAGARRRSDIFTSQTVTTLIWSTAAGRGSGRLSSSTNWHAVAPTCLRFIRRRLASCRTSTPGCIATYSSVRSFIVRSRTEWSCVRHRPNRLPSGPTDGSRWAGGPMLSATRTGYCASSTRSWRTTSSIVWCFRAGHAGASGCGRPFGRTSSISVLQRYSKPAPCGPAPGAQLQRKRPLPERAFNL